LRFPSEEEVVVILRFLSGRVAGLEDEDEEAANAARRSASCFSACSRSRCSRSWAMRSRRSSGNALYLNLDPLAVLCVLGRWVDDEGLGFVVTVLTMTTAGRWVVVDVETVGMEDGPGDADGEGETTFRCRAGGLAVAEPLDPAELDALPAPRGEEIVDAGVGARSGEGGSAGEFDEDQTWSRMVDGPAPVPAFLSFPFEITDGGPPGRGFDDEDAAAVLGAGVGLLGPTPKKSSPAIGYRPTFARVRACTTLP